MSELKAYTPKELVMQGRHNEPIYLKSEADKVIARHKYKRCLSMASLCHWKMGVFIYKEEKSDFYYRWWARWLKLADSFKEVW